MDARRPVFKCVNLGEMAQTLTSCLDLKRAVICGDWRRLLSYAPLGNPLAEPPVMYPLIEPTLDRFRERLATVAFPPANRVVRGKDTWPPHCHCGLNPFLEFYVRGERVVMAHFQLQAWIPPDKLRWVRDQFRILALEDIRGFGGVCQQNPTAKSTARAAQ